MNVEAETSNIISRHQGFIVSPESRAGIYASVRYVPRRTTMTITGEFDAPRLLQPLAPHPSASPDSGSFAHKNEGYRRLVTDARRKVFARSTSNRVFLGVKIYRQDCFWAEREMMQRTIIHAIRNHFHNSPGGDSVGLSFSGDSADHNVRLYLVT